MGEKITEVTRNRLTELWCGFRYQQPAESPEEGLSYWVPAYAGTTEVKSCWKSITNYQLPVTNYHKLVGARGFTPDFLSCTLRAILLRRMFKFAPGVV